MEWWLSRLFKEAPMSIWLIGSLLTLKLFLSINLPAKLIQIQQVAGFSKSNTIKEQSSLILTMFMVTVSIMTPLISAKNLRWKLKESTWVKKAFSQGLNSNFHPDLRPHQNTTELLVPFSMEYTTISISTKYNTKLSSQDNNGMALAHKILHTISTLQAQLTHICTCYL